MAEAERPDEIVVRWTARQVPALLVVAVTGAISLGAGSALAQDLEVEEKTEAGFPDEFTIEFDESHDWIRLTSGEWLRGDLNWMRDKDFEFDSDKLDIITKAWSKVDQFHSRQVNTYVFKGKADATGRAMVTKDEVIVETGEGVKTFARSELIAIVEGGLRERDWWSMRLAAGFSGSAGNTNQGSLNTDFGLARADQFTIAAVDYRGTFGYANREETVNRHLGRAAVILFIWERFYLVPAYAELFNDRFANIRFRASPASLGGVHIFDTRTQTGTSSPASDTSTRAISARRLAPRIRRNDGFVVVHTNWDFDITGDVELELDWRSNVVFTTIGNTNHRGSAIFSIEISDIFDFKTKLSSFVLRSLGRGRTARARKRTTTSSS